MTYDPIIYSFGVYVLYVLLPIIPAVVIFKMLPESTADVSGPLQKLKVKAGGAFAAYIVAVLLGYFPVQAVETQIDLARKAQEEKWNRRYPFHGVIVDLQPNQAIRATQLYTREMEFPTTGPLPRTRDYDFVLLLSRPVQRGDVVMIEYWENLQSGGTGTVPPGTPLEIKLVETDGPAQRFRLQKENDRPIVVAERAL
jgi:hypothetical protein